MVCRAVRPATMMNSCERWTERRNSLRGAELESVNAEECTVGVKCSVSLTEDLGVRRHKSELHNFNQ